MSEKLRASYRYDSAGNIIGVVIRPVMVEKDEYAHGHHRARVIIDEVGYWPDNVDLAAEPYYAQREQVPAICRHRTRTSLRFMHGAQFHDCVEKFQPDTHTLVWETA